MRTGSIVGAMKNERIEVLKWRSGSISAEIFELGVILVADLHLSFVYQITTPQEITVKPQELWMLIPHVRRCGQCAAFCIDHKAPRQGHCTLVPMTITPRVYSDVCDVYRKPK